ncbi:hypothetical protein EHQ68_16225 [Leptospira congkakensis]|uniref:Uncharacterized protein n=1 Tax=Leptospira congkakensis TaxID=2484932 RepID=A0A4Z1AF93_9LEPT|nr:hypothetical protein [Leptospira congkakensis]TGL86834.1 hypothetical protein EHQ68_16225 [Leptospira congkakensis]TGL93622.1 hypothetical protein EHQ69_03805 [Leptospira congkakensis]TGL94972.1 hypothetical protein EHQ70_16990 [Leptospira congkakensis]
MKKYRLTDQRTLLGIVSKLTATVLQERDSQQKFTLQNPVAVNDIMKSVHITIVASEPLISRPKSLICVLKENRVELRVKPVNPYQDDLLQVYEILIEPLERSAKRAAIEDISAYEIKMAQTADLGTVISIYGKTSIINQTLNQWQVHLEQTLTNYGYFIKKVQIGFYYAVDTQLMEALAASKAPYYVRDANRRIFYTDRSFYSPKKLSEIYIRSYLDSLLLNNTKSTLIFPFFSNGKVLLGYFEIISNLPDLGNPILQSDIEGPEGIGPLLTFLEQKAEEFIFQLEFVYAKDWETVIRTTSVRDISQDGRGIAMTLPAGTNIENRTLGSPVSFQMVINSSPYTFYGSLRSLKKGESNTTNIGVQIFQCDKPEGMSLLSTYASNLIGEAVYDSRTI